MATLAEQLASVQAAIADVELNGQTVGRTSSGAARSLTKADLKTLYAREADLKRQIAAAARAANGGGRAGITYITPA